MAWIARYPCARELPPFLFRVLLLREDRVPVLLVGPGDRFLAFTAAIVWEGAGVAVSTPSALDTSSPGALLIFDTGSFFGAGSVLAFLLSLTIVFPNAERT